MNRTFLTGYLVKDPELRTSANETNYCNPTIAVQRSKKEDGADFIRLSVFGKNAENLCMYQRKGNKIAVEGRLSVSSFDKDGQTQYRTDVMVERLEFLDRRGEAPAKDDLMEGFAKLQSDEVPF